MSRRKKLFIVLLLLALAGGAAYKYINSLQGHFSPAPHWQVIRESQGPGYTTITMPWRNYFAAPSPHTGSNYAMHTFRTGSERYDSYIDMGFLDPQHGWLLHHKITPNSSDEVAEATTDGGKTWRPSGAEQFKNHKEQLADPPFLSEAFGWQLEKSTGRLKHSTDGGKSWTIKRVFPKVAGRAYILFLRSERDLWVSCGKLFYHTADAGATWRQITLPGPDNVYFHTMAFTDARHGCLVLGSFRNTSGTPRLTPPVIFYTEDGGRSFRLAKLPPGLTGSDLGKFGHISFADRQSGWLDTGTPQLLHTSDGGKSWQRVPTGAETLNNPELTRVVFTDPSHGWIIGHASSLRVVQLLGKNQTYSSGNKSFVVQYRP